jgi:hypothetical protein
MDRGAKHHSRESADQRQAAGISLLDLGSLPPAPRRILRLLLRAGGMTYPKLCEAVEALPEADRLRQADLDEVLDRLIKQRWLIQRDSDQGSIYTVNLRRPARISLSQCLWDAVAPQPTEQAACGERCNDLPRTQP